MPGSPQLRSLSPSSATQDHSRAPWRDSNAAQSHTQDLWATAPNKFRKECQGCSEDRRPSHPGLHGSDLRVRSGYFPAIVSESADRQLVTSGGKGVSVVGLVDIRGCDMKDPSVYDMKVRDIIWRPNFLQTKQNGSSCFPSSITILTIGWTTWT